jgi:hypothetical protein
MNAIKPTIVKLVELVGSERKYPTSRDNGKIRRYIAARRN